MGKRLVIGACGQLGQVLTKKLQEKWGDDNIVASDYRFQENSNGRFVQLDATNYKDLEKLIVRYQVQEIYHLAAVLSARGEEKPLQTWDTNIKSLFNVLEISRSNGIKKVFYPSSIAVFGDYIDKNNTSQFSNLCPKTAYGISKVAGENWCRYYFDHYDLDVRSLRFPGIVGYQSLPGGGTTDYAIDIYHKAVNGKEFNCFLSENTTLPMIFMDDAIRAILSVMNASKQNIRVRTSYNISGMSFSPKQIANSIQKIIPHFKVTYSPDFRQKIAFDWPSNIDDTQAREDWNWKPKYNLDSMSEIMIKKLRKQKDS